MTQQPDAFEKLANEFEIGVFELGRELQPRNNRVLDGLVVSYCAAGRHTDALDATSELIRRSPDNPRFHYNHACVLSVLGRLDDACEALCKAVKQGFDDFDFMCNDPDLKALRDRPEFREWQKRALVQRSRRNKKVD